MGAAYRNSEYRLLLDPTLVPPRRDEATPVILRRGTVDDAELIARLIAQSFGDATEESHAWVLRTMSQGNHRYFVASVDGQPIGTIRTTFYDSTIYITGFGVLPPHRGRGYGRQILLQIVDLLVGERWPRVHIEVDADNRNALGLYLACGFKEVAVYGFYEQEI